MSNADLSALDGERGIPTVNARKPSSKKNFIVFLLMLLALAVVIAMVFFLRPARADDKVQKKEITPSRPPAPKVFSFKNDRPPRRPDTKADAMDGLPPPAAGSDMTRPPVAASEEAPKGIIDRGGAPLMTAGKGKERDFSARPRPEQEQGGSGGALDGMLSASRTPMARATKMPDLNFLLAKGASIPCTERTKIISSIAGMVVCTVSRDVYSANGNVVLIPRGSTIPGEKRALIERGSKRIGVLYTHIDTPDGIRVHVNSPGADALGASGIPGWVDDHFWQRFGGAILLSLIDDTAAAVANATRSHNGQVITMSGTSDAASNVASEAIKNTINIPPTLYANQGAQLTIIVARDLDFSPVYELTSEESDADE